jgi:hypothetical protein
MASTDIIYGITMIETGVSRVVPVDLRELTWFLNYCNHILGTYENSKNSIEAALCSSLGNLSFLPFDSA